MSRSPFSMRISRRMALSGAGATALVALASSLRAEQAIIGIENMMPGDYSWIPQAAPAGAVAVIVSIPEQRVHVYRNGIRIGVSTCSTGRPGHETPTGIFTILQKDKHHHSSTYNNAPMPNMNRLTWSGIALHAGNLPGYPASHGCIRLPMAFSEELFKVTHLGTPVIVSGSHDSWELVHPGLILGGGTADELAQAVAQLTGKAQPGDWNDAQQNPAITLLLTGADGRAQLIENDNVIAEDRLFIQGDEALGEYVMLLRKPAATAAELEWDTVAYSPIGVTQPRSAAQTLARLDAPEGFKQEALARLYPGATMIISDLRSTPDRRSGKDFVIMTGDMLTSPRPLMPGEPQPGAAADDRG